MANSRVTDEASDLTQEKFFNLMQAFFAHTKKSGYDNKAILEEFEKCDNELAKPRVFAPVRIEFHINYRIAAYQLLKHLDYDHVNTDKNNHQDFIFETDGPDSMKDLYNQIKIDLTSTNEDLQAAAKEVLLQNNFLNNHLPEDMKSMIAEDMLKKYEDLRNAEIEKIETMFKKILEQSKIELRNTARKMWIPVVEIELDVEHKRPNPPCYEEEIASWQRYIKPIKDTQSTADVKDVKHDETKKLTVANAATPAAAVMLFFANTATNNSSPSLDSKTAAKLFHS